MIGQFYTWLSDEEHAAAENGMVTLEATEVGLVWLTNRPLPLIPANLGPVHRGPHRYRVDVDRAKIHPWGPWRDKQKIDISDYFHLEVADRARPGFWWISPLPVVATHDPQ